MSIVDTKPFMRPTGQHRISVHKRQGIDIPALPVGAAKKIMAVFRYFRIGKDLSVKLLLSKRFLWREVEEKEFNEAIEELIAKGYIARMEAPEGWKLLDEGNQYIERLGRY